MVKKIRRRSSGKVVLAGGGSSKKIVRGCACRTYKFCLSLFLFLPHLNDPSMRLFEQKKHTILLKLGTFYHNLLKMHPIYVN